MHSRRDITIAVAITLGFVAASLPFAVRAWDLFPATFSAFGTRPPVSSFAAPFQQGAPFGLQPLASPPGAAVPFGQAAPILHARHHRNIHHEDRAWCVRGCDGRYFPIYGTDNKSREQSCSNFCPASRTMLVYGDDIDNAVTDNGKPYSELPNAFRYRNELVAGCTCDGKHQVGLVHIEIVNDPTLRKGDMVEGPKGLEVASRDADARGAPNFLPLPRSVRARYRQLPVVASGR
jgi:hypothetical protein